MARLRTFALVSAVVLVHSFYHMRKEKEHDEKAKHLHGVFPRGEALYRHFSALAELLRLKPGGSLFADYAEPDETTEKATLGVIQVGKLLTDIGFHDPLLIEDLSRILVNITSAPTGGAGVSESELRVVLDILRCYAVDADGQASSKPLRRLVARVSALASETRTGRDIANLIAEELHPCAPALTTWWSSGWSEWLSAYERGSKAVNQELAEAIKRPYVCAGRLPDRILSHAEKGEYSHTSPKGHVHYAPPKTEVAGIRAALKLSGVESLLARHLLAEGMLDIFDLNGDRHLNQKEMWTDAMKICQIYAALLARSSTATAVLRALMLPAPGGYPPAAFLSALTDGEATKAALVRVPDMKVEDGQLRSIVEKRIEQASAIDMEAPLTTEGLMLLAEAYIWFVPPAVLAAGDIKRKAARDEL